MNKFVVVLVFSIPSFIGSMSDRLVEHKKIHADHPIQSEVRHVLGCDITNTDVRVGVFEVHGKQLMLQIEYHAKAVEIADLYESIKNVVHDLAMHHHVTVVEACFAIPGIMKENGVFLHPHLPWNTSDDRAHHADKSQRGIVKQKFIDISGLHKVYFINDFQAAAVGVLALDTHGLKTLQSGKESHKKTKLVIGAGNGLGAALLVWDHELQTYVPSQLNYSFTEFGAQSELELEFFKYLKNSTGNVAWGKVLGAGAGGIKLIYKFFDAYEKQIEDAAKKYDKDDVFVEYDSYLDIFKHYDRSDRCADAVHLFSELYARMIRNAAYAQNALGGVYITNTIVQEHSDLFATEVFMKKIVDLKDIVLDQGSRNYLESYLATLPFYAVVDATTQLYGAAELCVDPGLMRS